MPTPFQLAAGVFGIVTGIAWIIWPARMSELQIKYLYFGASNDADDERTDTQILLGRVTGAVIAALGVAIVLGLIP